MIAFRGTVCSEGSTGNLRITVPIALGAAAPAWYVATVDTGTDVVSLLIFLRKPPSRPYPTFTLPKWAFPQLSAGVEIGIKLTPPVRAAGELSGFDWLRFVPEKCFPTQDGEDLVLHSQYEPPFRLRRSPQNLERHHRLLGYYQAEGSKAATGADWSFASALVEPARAALDMLEEWGVARSCCYVEVLHGLDESSEDAETYFAPLGVEVAASRPRSGRGGHAAVVHVRSSSLLREMTLRALRNIEACGFSSMTTAREYALGWLDGDGSVTMETSIRLVLAGLEAEHLVVREAFRAAFGWEYRGRGWLDNKQGTHVRLKLVEVVDLLEAGVFPYSMNRVKLLLAFDARTERLRKSATAHGPFRLDGASSEVRQGLLEHAAVRGYQLSAAGRKVVEAHARLRDEIEAVRKVAPPAGRVHRKGIAYPHGL